MTSWKAVMSAACLCLCLGEPASAQQMVDGGRYDQVRVVLPTGEMRAYVVLYADHGGWNAADEAALDALAAQGALAVGVDTDRYLAKIADGTRQCDQLVGDVEMLSRQLQHEHPGAAYRFPILAGIGMGGTLAGAVLAEAPVNTLSGAVSLDPAIAVPGVRPICPGRPATPEGTGAFRYGPIAALQGFWSVALSPAASAAARDHLTELQAAGTPIDVTEVAAADAASVLPALILPHLGSGTEEGVAALPLIELPAAEPSPLLAVVLSGDGGWRDLDKTIAEHLQEQGVSVVGWDSVRYFWNERTPKETSADLAAVLETYIDKWHIGAVALVGYSFGADVLPDAYTRLPAALRRKVVLISLLAFEHKADWEITVTGWLTDRPSEDATPNGPAVDKIEPKKLQCFYGEDEAESACPDLAPRGAEVIRTGGGHHFGGDYAALAKDILDALHERAHSLPSPT